MRVDKGNTEGSATLTVDLAISQKGGAGERKKVLPNTDLYFFVRH